MVQQLVRDLHLLVYNGIVGKNKKTRLSIITRSFGPSGPHTDGPLDLSIWSH